MDSVPFGNRRFQEDRRRSRKRFWFWMKNRRNRSDRRRGPGDRRIATFDRRQFFDGRFYVFKNRRRSNYDRRGKVGVWVPAAAPQEQENKSRPGSW